MAPSFGGMDRGSSTSRPSACSLRGNSRARWAFRKQPGLPGGLVNPVGESLHQGSVEEGGALARVCTVGQLRQQLAEIEHARLQGPSLLE